jgi:hypothetical protein
MGSMPGWARRANMRRLGAWRAHSRSQRRPGPELTASLVWRVKNMVERAKPCFRYRLIARQLVRRGFDPRGQVRLRQGARPQRPNAELLESADRSRELGIPSFDRLSSRRSLGAAWGEMAIARVAVPAAVLRGGGRSNRNRDDQLRPSKSHPDDLAQTVRYTFFGNWESAEASRHRRTVRRTPRDRQG